MDTEPYREWRAAARVLAVELDALVRVAISVAGKRHGSRKDVRPLDGAFCRRSRIGDA